MSPMNPRLLRPRASGAFDPSTVANLALYLDARDSSTITTVNDGTGDGVSEWRTKVTGSSLKAAQSSGTNRPYYVTGARNGKNVVQFDGTNDFLIQDVAAQRNQPFTIVWAGINQLRTDNTYGAWCDGGSTFSRILIYARVASGRLSYFAAGDEISAPVGSTAGFGDWSIISVVFNGANSVARANGTQVASGNPGGNPLNAGLNLGAAFNGTSANMKGQWGAWLIYHRLLSTAELQTVERGLGSIWGVAVA